MKRWQGLSWESRLLILFTVAAALPLFIGLFPASPPATEKFQSLATHIPKGHVLIPIEIENYEVLDSLLGSFGYVDLFRSGSRTPVARQVRLLRAPRNPTHFAALVREDQAEQILSHSGSYVATVRRDGGGTEIVNTNTSRPKRRILYGGSL